MSQEAKHEKERSERDFPFVGRLLGFLGLHGLLLAHRFGGLYGVLVSTEETVAPGEVLAVIVLEIAVVDVVMSSAVDELPIHESDAIVDGGGPDSDGNEQNKMGEFVHGDDVGAEPVGPRLCPSVEGVEREGREGAGKDKGVMQLVDWAVQQLAVQRVVDPVDAEVRDHEKEENRESPIRNRNGQIVEMIKFQVDFRIALLQAQMDGRINEGNHENRHQRRPELTLDLTLINRLVNLVNVVVALHDELRIEGHVVQRRHGKRGNAAQNRLRQKHRHQARQVGFRHSQRIKGILLHLREDDPHIVDIHEPEHVGNPRANSTGQKIWPLTYTPKYPKYEF